MDYVGFEPMMLFILNFFLFFKNCIRDSTLLGGAQPYYLVRQYFIILVLLDPLHCVRNTVSSKHHLSFH